MWNILFAGTDRAAGLVQWTAGVVSIPGVMVLARAMGRTKPQSLFAGLLWATFPQVLLQSTTTQNDLTVAATAGSGHGGGRRGDGQLIEHVVGVGMVIHGDRVPRADLSAERTADALLDVDDVGIGVLLGLVAMRGAGHLGVSLLRCGLPAGRRILRLARRLFALAGLHLNPSDQELLDDLAELDPSALQPFVEAALTSEDVDKIGLANRLAEIDPAAALSVVHAALDANPDDRDLLLALLDLDEGAGLTRVRTALARDPHDDGLLGLLASSRFFSPASLWPRCGSMATTRTLRSCSFRFRPTPVRVPQVPYPARKNRTRPSVCCQISGPVVV